MKAKVTFPMLLQLRSFLCHLTESSYARINMGDWPSVRSRWQDILYLHNPIIHLYNPPKYLHRHCFRFLLGHLHVPGVIANNDYATFWGVKEVYYGICAGKELAKFVFLHKLIKKEQGQYQATLTEHAWSIKDLLYDLRGNCSCGVVPNGGDQSQHRIWFILHAHGASHIIIMDTWNFFILTS